MERSLREVLGRLDGREEVLSKEGLFLVEGGYGMRVYVFLRVVERRLA